MDYGLRATTPIYQKFAFKVTHPFRIRRFWQISVAKLTIFAEVVYN